MLAYIPYMDPMGKGFHVGSEVNLTQNATLKKKNRGLAGQ